jgi:hypothetical protein
VAARDLPGENGARYGSAVSPEGTTLSDAVRLLMSAAANEGGDAQLTLLLACSAAQTSLAEDLERTHTAEQEDRHEELSAFLEDPSGQPLARETWALVLAQLAAEEQRSLQALYEELARGAELAIEYGEPAGAEKAEEFMQTLYPVEALLAELPHTTLGRSLGTDDHELRRRALFLDVSWVEPGGEAEHEGGSVDVIWRDGYQSTVARMGAAFAEEHGCWVLDISDPAPGRTASLVIERRSGESGQDAARRTFEAAIAWANLQLGDDYVVQAIPREHR